LYYLLFSTSAESKKNKRIKKKDNIQESKEAMHILPPFTPEIPEFFKFEPVTNIVRIKTLFYFS